MTTAVEDPTKEQETEAQEAPQAPESAAERNVAALFKWSEYVHVGIGAEECENRENGKCRDPEHFHAWCRLANQFQLRDITEKSHAARARRIMALKDPDSDARIIMEEELQRIRESDMKDLLIDEILDQDFNEVMLEAVRTVDDIDAEIPELESEGEEPVKLYATIDQDREEYRRLRDLPEDQRGEDFDKLEQRVEAHAKAVTDEKDRILKVKREPLEKMDWDQLIEIVRSDRIKEEGDQAALQAFNTWHWYVCTYKPVPQGRPSERVFSSYNAMRYEADSAVVAAIEATFADLESRLATSRAVGKS
jgi:ribosomal protein L16 Arg81 hydroxylase